MKGSTKIFHIFGIDIHLHYSWWIIFLLLSWSLATAFFPTVIPHQSATTYWLMGIVSALLLFLSVLLHELSHSLVAKLKHIKVESITLFFFGGVAGITDEEMKPSTEFIMAIAGPGFTLLLSGIFYLLFRLNGNPIITAMTQYLAQVNLALALFNLVPGFPLDGGRAFRALLYGYYKDLQKATRIACLAGKMVGGSLIVLGLYGMWSGLGNGLWFILLGGFLYFLAGRSYEQVVIQETLKHIAVKDLMKKKFLALDPEMNLSNFLQQHAADEQESFLVRNNAFVGIVDTRRIRRLDATVKLKELAFPVTALRGVSVQGDGYAAFKLLQEQDLDILPVLEKGKLLGIISRRTVLHYLTWYLKYGSFIKRHKK